MADRGSYFVTTYKRGRLTWRREKKKEEKKKRKEKRRKTNHQNKTKQNKTKVERKTIILIPRSTWNSQSSAIYECESI